MRLPRIYCVGLLILFFCLGAWGVTKFGGWLAHVPDSDRKRTNPCSGQNEAIAAGSKMFADHCAKCHGADALGSKKKPSLRTAEVQQATDGEIFWLLKNGDLRHGMPSWSAIPEPSRWQIITYVKSLGTNSAETSRQESSK
jgi:mono/diheme cytochrome c family protein